MITENICEVMVIIKSIMKVMMIIVVVEFNSV